MVQNSKGSICTPTFHSSIIHKSRSGDKSSVHDGWMDGYKKCGIYTKWTIIQP